ncbi:MAG TPA: lactate utilization protein [Candidatus Dormibacteraeota bacterium]|nr:lactate utilization protein [Candidatus Dormibacteraeota bacterium]
MDTESSRKRILDRMRHALAAHPPQGQGSAAIPDRGGRVSVDGIFAPIEDSLARFRAECEANHTQLHLVTAESEADCLRKLLRSEQIELESRAGSEKSRVFVEPIFVQDAPELRRLIEAAPMPVRWSSDGPPAGTDLAGITLAEALVARTGSVLISSLNGGRAASVLPPLHIVYAPISQLVKELVEAIERVQASGRVRDVSMLSLIAGPSRTSDIEKMLVLGAHGPRRLAILLRL